MFLKNRNIISKIKRSKVTDYAALTGKEILFAIRGHILIEADLYAIFLSKIHKVPLPFKEKEREKNRNRLEKKLLDIRLEMKICQKGRKSVQIQIMQF